MLKYLLDRFTFQRCFPESRELASSRRFHHTMASQCSYELVEAFSHALSYVLYESFFIIDTQCPLLPRQCNHHLASIPRHNAHFDASTQRVGRLRKDNGFRILASSSSSFRDIQVKYHQIAHFIRRISRLANLSRHPRSEAFEAL